MLGAGQARKRGTEGCKSSLARRSSAWNRGSQEALCACSGGLDSTPPTASVFYQLRECALIVAAFLPASGPWITREMQNTPPTVSYSRLQKHTTIGTTTILEVFFYIVYSISYEKSMAEREGFEPPVRANGQRFSRPPHSTTLPPLRIRHCPVDPGPTQGRPRSSVDHRYDRLRHRRFFIGRTPRIRRWARRMPWG